MKKRNLIKHFLREGLSSREVAKKVSLSQSTVWRLQKEEIMSVKLKGGQKEKLSETTKRALIRDNTSGKFDTAVQLSKDVTERLSTSISPQTIRNYLKKLV